MGKLKNLQITLEEAVNDYANDLSYEIHDYIEEKRHELLEMAESLASDMLDEHELSFDDLETIGINLEELVHQAWDDNRDY